MLHTLQTQDQCLRPGQEQHPMPYFDANATEESIVQRHNAYLLAPGTVHVAFIDTKSANVTPSDLCSTSKRFRRR